MIFLIFIKNIKKMNCLILLIWVVNDSENGCFLSDYVLGNFLGNVFYGKILSFL